MEQIFAEKIFTKHQMNIRNRIWWTNPWHANLSIFRQMEWNGNEYIRFFVHFSVCIWIRGIHLMEFKKVFFWRNLQRKFEENLKKRKRREFKQSKENIHIFFSSENIHGKWLRGKNSILKENRFEGRKLLWIVRRIKNMTS